MNKSIRYYYFTSIATVLIASIMIMGLLQTYLAITYFKEEKKILLGKVVSGVTLGVSEGKVSQIDNSLQAIGYMAHVAGAVIFIAGPDGAVMLSTEGAPPVGSIVDEKYRDNILTNGYTWENSRLGGMFERNYYTYGGPLIDASGSLRGYVFASADSSGLGIYLQDMISSFVLSAGLVLLVSSMLALMLANRAVIPLRHINEAARKFGEGDYSARVPVEGDKELAQLAITFNNMANSFEATDQSRRSFMGNIAHELRTPMTSIKGFIDGMLDGTIPEDQRDKYLGIVSEEVGRLARLTKNMLDISKLEAGEYTPNVTEFNVWEPIMSVFLASEQRLADKSIEVKGITGDSPVLIHADSDFVHQILFNLVDNAIKFTDPHGTITVSVTPGRGMSTVAIRNTGQGIQASALPYVFDRFYKEDKSRGVNAKGSGLGLHISKVLVGLMGGRIWVESEYDHWTQFSFTVPNAPLRKKKK